MQKRTRQMTTLLQHQHCLLLCLSLSNAFLFLSSLADNSTTVPSDAFALLAFKSKADVRHNLIPFSPNTTSSFCKWAGVQCYARTRVVRLVIQGLDLGGVWAPNTLTSLDQLRVLGLQNNSLTGTIPDISGLKNLKTLFLDHNSFAGSFPPSILSLHRLKTLDLSHNNLTGSLPSGLTRLDRLNYLRLEWNRLNGSVPPLNQSSLKAFNVSGNNLTGAVPVTPTLLRLEPSSFSSNPGLCGEIIHKECSPSQPFFGSSSSPLAAAAAPPKAALGLEVNGVDLASGGKDKHSPRTALIVGFSCAVLVLVCSVLCFAMAVKKRRSSSGDSHAEDDGGGSGKKKKRKEMTMMSSAVMASSDEAEEVRREQEKELEEKVKRAQMGVAVAKSGSLAFCAGEAQLYSLDQLMRASAELLGRGTIGTTYKAVLDNRLIVSVKRLDASKLAGTSREAFERHMESVGGLRHPNLVPLRAYFQAKEERLLIYDYQPNGSLYSLIHGSKSTRAKPLHWTSCLKIAEDVAQGLSYIHQAWRLVHGNLNSHNVLLGPDFEACVADYCLSVLVTSPSPPLDDDPAAHLHSAAYKAPEIRNGGLPATSKSDVYAFGVLLLELLTGKPPSQLPVLAPPDDVAAWARSARDGVDGQTDGAGENSKMEMLLEVAVACSLASPEPRPTMWQVMKMLQEIKDAVLMEDNDQQQQDHPPPGVS